MKKYNSLSIPNDIDRFQNDDKYYAFLGRVLRLLIECDQNIKVWNDGYTTCFEFNSSDYDYGDPQLEWVDPEIEAIYSFEELSREAEEDSGFEQDIAISEFFTRKLSDYLAERNIDFLDFYSEFFLDKNTKLVDISIDEFITLVEKYCHKSSHCEIDNEDRMIEENEQH